MAARIPQDFLDQLLERIDLVELIDNRVPLRKTGQNFSACCPFQVQIQFAQIRQLADVREVRVGDR